MRILCLGVVALLSVSVWAESEPTVASVEVIDATVRVPLPGKDNTTAYFLLRNSGDKERSLTQVRADFAERAELHSHEMNDGMMRMRQVETVAIPAGGEVRFQSGGYHVMLFNLNRRPRTGDPLNLVLEFDDGSHQAVTAHAVSVFDRPHH